jgi:hypothetical protein
MSDQAQMEQSPQDRLMAMLDVADDEVLSDELIEQEEVEEAETEAEDVETDEQADEEAEQDDEPETEAEDDEDSDEQPQTFKLKIRGEEIEKPLEEVINLAQMGADYTQKTQEVAEQRRQLEDYAQTIKVQEESLQRQYEAQQMFLGEVADIKAIDSQLAHFANVNWQELSDNDFVEAQKLFFTHNQLQEKRRQITANLEVKATQMQQMREAQLQKQVEQGKAILAKEIPNWSQKTSQDIILTGKEYGFNDDELGAIIDPRHVKVLHDAMQWRKLKSNSVVKNKVSQAKPVVKAGSKDTKQEASSATRQVREQLRKTGKSDYAQKLIEDMI